MAATFTATQEMSASPERVYRALTDLDGAREWMPGLVRIERLDDPAAPFGPGTRWRETRRMFGREATEEFEVTDAEPGRRIDLYVDGRRGSSKRGEYRFTYRLSADGPSTFVRLDGEVGGLSGPLALLSRLMVRPFRKACERDLRALRRHVEGRTRQVARDAPDGE